MPDDLREYFRDVHDHLRRVSRRIADFRVYVVGPVAGAALGAFAYQLVRGEKPG